MSGISKKLMSASGGVAGPVEAQAVDFDGTSDYLSRSDLVGNTDSKTFTFSAWVYNTKASSTQIYRHSDGWVNFWLRNGTELELYASSSGSFSYVLRTDNVFIELNTWNHILVSIDLSNPANRYVYVNDTDETSNVTWTTYSNTAIGFTETPMSVAANTIGGVTQQLKGRLSNVFLDYTYRNLSVEANRRLFITDKGTPASGQASLSPILYLPMDDPADVGRNDGTGGNFTLNGIVARSGRGPNQYNAAASTFDGTADYLSRTSLTGIADGKVFTAAFSIKQKDFLSDGSYQYVFAIKETGSVRFGIRFDTAGNLQVFGTNSGGATRLLSLASKANMGYADNKYIHVAISFDMADPAKRRCFINGQSVFISASTHDNEALDFTTPEYAVGAQTGPSDFLDGELSDLWFSTTYIDLSTNNPFYDTETDKPKFLGEFGELPTGSAPLIYLPLRADDAGNNKGTGGDFTVNSGPYVGARGPSEFWSGSGYSIAGANYLRNTSLSGGGSSVSQLTAVMAYKVSGSSSTLLQTNGNASSSLMWIKPIANSGYRISFRNTDGNDVIEATSTTPLVANTWHTLLMSFDVTSTAKRHVYLNGVDAGFEYNKYVTSNRLEVGSGTTTYLLGTGTGTSALGRMGFLWFDTTYIDFSQEANRLKFFDAFQYPVDVGVDGSLPTGNAPMIYMNEGFHLGTNLGYGGNFTQIGTHADGGYVKG